jgi:hypothetical protein
MILLNKDIVIMTKSSKNKQYCIAGIDIRTCEWIRLVSDNEETAGAISSEMLLYEDGYECQPLDVVNVAVGNMDNKKIQSENYLVQSEFKKVKTMKLDEVIRLKPPKTQGEIFENLNYKLTADEAQQLSYSLIWIKVEKLCLFTPVVNNKPKTKASFIFGGNAYSNMSITDPMFYNKNGEYDIAYLVLSIPQKGFGDNNEYFKFISKIFLPSGQS